MHLGVVETGDGRRAHDVAPGHAHGIVETRGDGAVAHDVLVELHVHDAVFLQRVEGAGFPFARLQPAQRFGERHLIDHDLRLGQGLLGDAVAGLDDAGLVRAGCGGDAGGLAEKVPDGHGVGGVIRALIDDLEHVVRADDAGSYLNPARAPAAGHGHFAAGEGHLIAGDRHGLEQAAPDHPLGRFVKVGEGIALEGGARVSLWHGRCPCSAAWPASRE